ncbi:MAG TPA: TerB family tellurite resistance protein [Crenotrichaceae bacterium]|nr:TerB family tellurite resistance protein [Crenotrichaceae bacterium]
MLNKIKLFFDEHLKISDPEQSSAENLRVACAALFLEMMMMDEVVESKEQKEILELLRNNFSLTTEQATALIDVAEQQRQQAVDYYRFIALINKEYTQQQKVELVESLWKIAFVDGVLDENEEYLVRKIANLLHVPHTAFIITKNRVSSAQILQ